MLPPGSYPSPTSTYPFQQTIWVQINAGARATATVNNPPVSGFGTFYVGESSNTSPREYCAWKMDQLAFFPFVFSPGDVTALYNSGSGRAWPFTFNN